MLTYFIQQQEFRIHNKSPGYGNSLFLATRQTDSPFTDQSVVAFFKLRYKVMSIGLFCCFSNLKKNLITLLMVYNINKQRNISLGPSIQLQINQCVQPHSLVGKKTDSILILLSILRIILLKMILNLDINTKSLIFIL